MSEYPLPTIPPDLARACVDNECVLYAGSGLSAQAGFATWVPLLSGLLEWAETNDAIDQSFASSLREAMELGDFNSVADSLVRALGDDKTALSQYLYKQFYKPYVVLPESYKVLEQIPFAALLTTNFDNLLELTFDISARRVLTPYDAEPLLTALSRKDHFLLKLYGKVETPDTVLLSPAQYLHATQENLLFSQFMENLFFSRTLLFIGASLKGIADYLSGIKFRGTTPPRRHYCLIDVKGTAWRAQASNLQARYNIEVLPYTASDDYRELPEFLQQLQTQVSSIQQTTAPTTSTPQFPVTHLKRVRLENIGPFDDQTFELTEGWNMLFGDNGVGKSNFLKAVAVGLCGESAKAYVDRMIKTKTSSGVENPRGTITIDVVTDVNGEKKEKIFKTTLFRSDFGGEISSHPPRPLESEGWLAVGFPPMRIISWKREETEQTAQTDRPMPSDLIPLIVGESDPRLDSLKGWLIELDNEINRDFKNGIVNSKSLKLRKDFFDVIAALTPKVDIDFGEIRDGKIVLVKTPDGLVPIEAVSQGTSSLMGWVGVLLRRLFDLYKDVEKPREQHALVLIDEIDAHMHPEWQRQLIPKIRELFPKIQVIATTHSPLLVPSLNKGEIVRLEREPGDKRIKVTLPQYDLHEYPTNQILTSPLFGLENSLPPRASQILDRYKQLAAKSELTEAEQSERRQLATELNVRLPSPKETTAARAAYNLIKVEIAKKLAELPMETRDMIDKEIKVQLEELVTGERLPR